MRVLVAGAAGVVGRAVTSALAPSHELVLLDRRELRTTAHTTITADILDYQLLNARLAKCGRIDAVVHLAYAAVTPTALDDEKAIQQFDTSVKGTWLLLNAARRCGARKCVYGSTMTVFGRLRNGPYTDETDPWSFSDIGAYGLCKRLGEDVVRYFAHSRRLPGVSLRLYGVHEPQVMERRGTHVDDIGEAFRLALTKETGTYEAINLAPGIPGIDISNAKAERLLGWKPINMFENRARTDG